MAPERRYARCRMASIVVLWLATAAPPAAAVPSFARQTGLACRNCHTVFPELTPFGRTFKLNGYQLDTLPQVPAAGAPGEPALQLAVTPPLSLMFQTSYTRTGSSLPDSAVADARAQNGQMLFPQQASLFYAGRIAPGLGTFIQITYDSQAGTVGWDNTELRYARHAGSDWVYGGTFNNNPTVQDPWNSTPAWQVPFDQRTSAAPTPAAATQIDGGLADRGVVGVTGYAWWKNMVYGEAGVYRSSPQGFSVNDLAGPLDSTAEGVITGAAPYWRVAVERQWGQHSVSGGGYGILAKIHGADEGAGTPRDRYNDVAADGQYQYIGETHIVSAQATFIRERQTLDARLALEEAEHLHNNLRTARAGGSYYFRRTIGAALGVFSTTGSSDALLYPAAPVWGFETNSPNSRGWTGEIVYIPWQNVKMLVQYTRYQKFNGAGTDYDGAGRNAADNNTLYVLGWVAF